MSSPPLPLPNAVPRDAKAWLVSPALIFILALFVYPFIYSR
jgi:putative spermidine/putrescine transport system permease protein